MKSTRYFFDHLRNSLFILAITMSGLGLSLGLTSFQTSTNAASAQTREVRVLGGSALTGQAANVSVELVALGNENAVGFSLNFNPAIFTDATASLGSGATGASFNFNYDQTNGRLGVTLALPAGQVFAAGTRQIVNVVLVVAASAPAGPTPITFGNVPVTSEVSDAVASPLPATFTPGAVTIIQPNPLPSIVAFSPPSAIAGGVGFNLIVNGNNFVNGSVVRWNGTARQTLFSSSSRVTALITTEDIASAGTATITVFNPAPGGGSSSGQTFAINNPAPAVAGVTPNSATTGSADVAITVNGTGFTSSSKARFNGADLATTFGGATQLTATIPAGSLTAAGVANITVFNPTPGGGTSSATAFTVNNQVPAITSLAPNSAVATGPAFTLTVNGSNLVNGSTVQWNGTDRTTTFVSATQVTAAITAADIATVGTANVTVVNPAPGGGTSNALTFSITQPPVAPTITSISPGFAIVGGPQFTLTVNGTNFANNSVVRWNDSDRVTTFVSATQLTATIPATDIAAQGTANIKVFTPPPGGGTSNTVPFFIGAQFTSVSAASYLGNDLAAASIIAGFGLNLATQTQFALSQPLPTTLAGTTVKIRDSAGTERMAPLFYVSAQQINYQAPPDIADGLATVVATSGDNKISVGALQVARVAPGAFSATSTGKGLAAAVILRVKPGNVQTFEAMVRFDSGQSKFVPVPVDLTAATDDVFLVLFGTGIRFRSSMSAVGATIGGTNAQVDFAGVAPNFTGLDQCNIRIPRSLIGRGEIDVVLTVNGKVANTVTLSIK